VLKSTHRRNSRDSRVSVVSMLWILRSGVRILEGAIDLSVLQKSVPAPEPTYSVGNGGSVIGVKRPGRETDYLPLSVAEV
jgi:hypothetical protein